MIAKPDLAQELPAAYVRAVYAIALLLILAPPLDVLVQMNRFDWGTVSWRFGFLGLMSGALLLPLLGALLASVTARLVRHRRIALLLAIGCGIVALLLLGMMMLFVLDAVQLRGQITPQATRVFDPPVVKSLVFQVLMLVVLGMLAQANLRGWRGARHAAAMGAEAAVLVRPPSP